MQVISSCVPLYFFLLRPFFYEAAERVWRRLLQRNLKLSSYCIILICMYLSLRYFRSKLVIGHV